MVSDALTWSHNLRCGDLVVVDPPYSEVQYSRFYHVLETVARGGCGFVEGAGRYPPFGERPQSDFSRKGRSGKALDVLLEALSASDARVIFTFPTGNSSNGLCGDDVIRAAQRRFRIAEKRVVTGTFSTLGGGKGGRAPRQVSQELLLLLYPR